MRQRSSVQKRSQWEFLFSIPRIAPCVRRERAADLGTLSSRPKGNLKVRPSSDVESHHSERRQSDRPGRRPPLRRRIDTVRLLTPVVSLSAQARRCPSRAKYPTGMRLNLRAADRRTRTRLAQPEGIFWIGTRLRGRLRLFWPLLQAVDQSARPAASQRRGQKRFRLRTRFRPRG